MKIIKVLVIILTMDLILAGCSSDSSSNKKESSTESTKTIEETVNEEPQKSKGSSYEDEMMIDPPEEESDIASVDMSNLMDIKTRDYGGNLDSVLAACLNTNVNYDEQDERYDLADGAISIFETSNRSGYIVEYNDFVEEFSIYNAFPELDDITVDGLWKNVGLEERDGDYSTDFDKYYVNFEEENGNVKKIRFVRTLNSEITDIGQGTEDIDISDIECSEEVKNASWDQPVIQVYDVVIDLNKVEKVKDLFEVIDESSAGLTCDLGDDALDDYCDGYRSVCVRDANGGILFASPLEGHGQKFRDLWIDNIQINTNEYEAFYLPHGVKIYNDNFTIENYLDNADTDKFPPFEDEYYSGMSKSDINGTYSFTFNKKGQLCDFSYGHHKINTDGVF